MSLHLLIKLLFFSIRFSICSLIVRIRRVSVKFFSPSCKSILNIVRIVGAVLVLAVVTLVLVLAVVAPVLVLAVVAPVLVPVGAASFRWLVFVPFC